LLCVICTHAYVQQCMRHLSPTYTADNTTHLVLVPAHVAQQRAVSVSRAQHIKSTRARVRHHTGLRGESAAAGVVGGAGVASSSSFALLPLSARGPPCVDAHLIIPHTRNTYSSNLSDISLIFRSCASRSTSCAFIVSFFGSVLRDAAAHHTRY
jgi:hypothetical protein